MRPTFHQCTAAEEAIEDRDLDALRHALSVCKDNPNTLVHQEYKYTLLHLAMELYAPAVPVLLEFGANPLLTDDKGRTPRDWSREYAIPISINTALIRAEYAHKHQDEAATIAHIAPRPQPTRRARM